MSIYTNWMKQPDVVAAPNDNELLLVTKGALGMALAALCKCEDGAAFITAQFEIRRILGGVNPK